MNDEEKRNLIRAYRKQRHEMWNYEAYDRIGALSQEQGELMIQTEIRIAELERQLGIEPMDRNWV